MSESVCKLRLVSDNSLHGKSEAESEQSIVSSQAQLSSCQLCFSFSSCRICLSLIFEPATLSCGHKFCETCLDQYWQAEEKPGFIVCPLCRTNAFNVNFTKKEVIKSSRDFRKVFQSSYLDISDDSVLIGSTPFCLKLGIIVPAVYFMFQLLQQPIRDLFNFFQDLYLSMSSMI